MLGADRNPLAVTSSTRIAAVSPQSGGLLLACALSIALLCISVGRLAVDLGDAAFNLNLARSALEVPIWSSRLGANLGLFLLALTGLHLALGIICWVLARLSEFALPAVRCRRRDWILLWFLAATVLILVANATWFPRSSLGEPYHELVAAAPFGVNLLTLVTGLLVAGIAAIAGIALRRVARRRALLAAGAASGLIAAMLLGAGAAPATLDLERPHIIILGIDSLRPDAIDVSRTPNVKKFMDGAIRMTDAITPLARTFPSWASILTGRNPHTTGAYMNLLPRELVHTGATLPDILRQRGYRTWYAIDETRFSNIDASYGFDRTLTPEMGGSDFMLARMADTPLSNLVVNTRLGAMLFPHLHTNRAASTIYDPDSFVQRLARKLDFGQPSFVAVHFTLPHWPFTWATSNTDGFRNDPVALYTQSIKRADQQFGDLLAALERKGVLRNALVITLSDHGEALGHEDEFLAEAYPAQDGTPTDYQRWGHGTSVFSPQQYRVALAFRAYGTAKYLLAPGGIRTDPASLVDLAPTILDLLDFVSTEGFDGVSLAPLLQAEADSLPELRDRIRYTESEYNPQGFDARQFSTSQLAAAATVYRLDPDTDRITVKKDLLSSIMSSRQYAALLGNRAMAAAVPTTAGGGTHEFVFVPMYSPQAAEDPGDPARLAAAMREHYKIEIAGIP